jgi:hypothetical protein
MGNLYVLQDGNPPDEVKGLKDEPQLFSPYMREFVIRGFTYIFVQKQKFAPRRPIQAPDYVHKRGLAAAGRALEGYEIALFYVQVYSLQDRILAIADAVGFSISISSITLVMPLTSYFTSRIINRYADSIVVDFDDPFDYGLSP